MNYRELETSTSPRNRTTEVENLLTDTQFHRDPLLGANVFIPVAILVTITVWAMIETLSAVGANTLSFIAFGAQIGLVACGVMAFFEINKRGPFW